MQILHHWAGGAVLESTGERRGTEGVHFFTRGKVVTTRWIDPARRSSGELDLGFPRNR